MVEVVGVVGVTVGVGVWGLAAADGVDATADDAGDAAVEAENAREHEFHAGAKVGKSAGILDWNISIPFETILFHDTKNVHEVSLSCNETEGISGNIGGTDDSGSE